MTTTPPPGPPGEEWPAETTVVQPGVPPPPPGPPPVAPPPEGEPGWSIGLGMLLAIAVVAVAAAVIAAIVLTRDDKKGNSATTVLVTTAPATTTTATTKKLTLPVPDLVGRPLNEATAGLQRAGLHATLVTVPSDLPRGTIVAQDPPGGTTVAKGSDVRLNVSAGSKAQATTTQPETTTQTQATTQENVTTTAETPPGSGGGQVPSLSGDLQPALQKLDGAGFIARIAYVPGDQPLGTVVAQSPEGGATAQPNSEVTVNVSSGPVSSSPNRTADQTVPDVVGKKIPEAVQALRGAGLRLIFLRAKVTDKSQAGIIQAQTPEPGDKAPKNAQVLVYMGAYTQ
jgi:beta-lactam-binding protein with PASTA domain